MRWKMGVLWLHRKETLVCRPLANRVSLVSPCSRFPLSVSIARVLEPASGRQHNAMTQRRRVAVITRLQTRNGQRQWRLNRTMKTRRLFAEQRPAGPVDVRFIHPDSRFTYDTSSIPSNTVNLASTRKRIFDISRCNPDSVLANLTNYSFFYISFIYTYFLSTLFAIIPGKNKI